jgi:hypothetical protein
MTATRTTAIESAITALSNSILPERFGGDALIVVLGALLVAILSIVGAMRWRAAQELRFPGLEDVRAWERIGGARVYAKDGDRIEEVRIIPRGGAREDGARPPVEGRVAEPASPPSESPASPASPPASPPAGTSPGRPTRERILIDDLANVQHFDALRDDLHRRLGRTQMRVTAASVTIAAVVLIVFLR